MTFQNRFNLERHVKSKLCESGKSKYSCSLCKTECCSKNNLRDHVKKHHLLKCEICGLSFSRNSALRTHRLGGDDLPCDDCDKVFCNQKQLRLHEKIHQKTTIVECEYCKQTFSKVWMLLRHKKSEAVCQKCKQKFCAKAKKCLKCHQN